MHAACDTVMDISHLSSEIVVLFVDRYNSAGSSGVLLSMTWGCHGGEYEDGCLLGCSAV
jgi:hypothetical protein